MVPSSSWALLGPALHLPSRHFWHCLLLYRLLLNKSPLKLLCHYFRTLAAEVFAVYLFHQ